jgi:hypothetical protein
MSTYSSNLGTTLISTGDQSGVWGNTTNYNLGTLMEQAISSYVTQQFSSADVTLYLVAGSDAGGNTVPGTIYTSGTTAVPVSARNMYIECQGTSTGNNLIVPNNTKLYYIYNNITSGGGTITVKTGSGTGVAIPVGQRAAVVCNGTNVVLAASYFATLASPSVAITGGTIDGTTIGSTTASTIKGTTITATSGFSGSLAATTITASGATVLGSPTGGAQGAGTLNATGLFVNGVAVNTGNGSVSLVAMTVPSFLSVSGSPITTSGTFAVSLSGTALPVTSGGSGATTLTGYVYGNGTGAMTASTTIPGSAISGNISGNAATATNATYATSAGNASTVTNGVYTTSSYSNPSWITSISGSIVSGAVASATNATYATSAGSVTNGLTTSNYNSYAPTLTGGGANGTWGINITGNAATVTNGLTTSNYNSYAPTLTGGNASGTWGINITGNAATATSASSATNITAYTINQSVGTGNSPTFSAIYANANIYDGSNTNWFLRASQTSYLYAMVGAGGSTFDAVSYLPWQIWTGLSINVNNSNPTTAMSFLEVAGSSRSGWIGVSGSTTSYNTSSDYRLKNNPQVLANSGSVIDALIPRTWTWTNGSAGIGLIAHEAQAAGLTQSVHGTKDAMVDVGTLFDASGEVLGENVRQPPTLQGGQTWVKTGQAPDYQSMEYGSAEMMAYIIAELKSLRSRLKAANIS